MQKRHITAAFYADMIYRLQIKRVAAGYTQEELSFLLGYPLDQVSRIEAFDTDALAYLTDLNRLALIFDCDLLTLTPGYPVSQQRIEILTEYEQDPFRNHYTVYQGNAEGQSELLYKLVEDSPEYRCQPKGREVIKIKLQELISQLIAIDYFTHGAEAWDIYANSREQLQRRYPPQLLQEVLQEYISGDHPQLEVRQEENRIAYFVKEFKRA